MRITGRPPARTTNHVVIVLGHNQEQDGAKSEPGKLIFYLHRRANQATELPERAGS